MRIQHNIAAMNAYRNYNTNTSAVSKNLEKLSSGYKINRAGDDAAGLAISEKMRAQISGLQAASKNVKDGISLVKTAEGAMQEVQDMLNRMVTLATQSANGTYDNEVDRLNLQKEVDQLRSEINRIADSSNFNGIKLMDGSQEIKTSYEMSSPTSATGAAGEGFRIVSDGQLGVDPQAGVFQYDFSQLEFEVKEQVDANGNGTGNYVVEAYSLDDPRASAPAAQADSQVASGGGVQGGGGTQGGSGTQGTQGTGSTSSASSVTSTTITSSGSVSGVKVTFQMGTLVVSLDLEVGKYSGSDMAAKIVEAFNKINSSSTSSGGGTQGGSGTQGAGGTQGSGGTQGAGGTTSSSGASQSLAGVPSAHVDIYNSNGDLVTPDSSNQSNSNDGIAGHAATATGNAPVQSNLLQGKPATMTANNGIITITMDEAPSQQWNTDMTMKINGANGGEQFKPTVLTEPIDSTTSRQYAQATIDLTQLSIKDGTSIQIGKTTYTFAIGSDSRFKNSDNVVDLTDMTKNQFSDKSDMTAWKNAIARAGNRLSKAAAANTTFFVGSDTRGMISLTEKEGAVDYSVNNLAGKDNKGTSGYGNGLNTVDGDHSSIKTGTVNTATDPNATMGVDATVNDWKGLVKIGQASVSGSGLTLQIGDTSDSYNQLTVSIGDIHTKALDINDIDISTQTGAQAAISKIRTAINSVSSIRGTLGATQNRLEHTANNLSVMTENIQDAESTIRDTDIAEEMMAYTKNNILVQSAQAMLAQANQIPQGVLQLLG